jgi:hypothetical protein
MSVVLSSSTRRSVDAMTTKSSRASKQMLFSTRKQRKTTYENHLILIYSTYNRISSSVTMMFSLNWETKHFYACSRSEFASFAWERRDENKRFELSQTFLFHRFVNTDCRQIRLVSSLRRRCVDVISSSRDNLVNTVEYTISQITDVSRWNLSLSTHVSKKIDSINVVSSLQDIQRFESSKIYSRKVVFIYTTRAKFRDMLQWDRQNDDEETSTSRVCVSSTRLLEEKLVKISRTQAWLIRWVKKRVALTRRRRFDISCKTWSICLKKISANNEKSKLRDCVRDENESWCAMTAIDYSRLFLEI